MIMGMQIPILFALNNWNVSTLAFAEHMPRKADYFRISEHIANEIACIAFANQ